MKKWIANKWNSVSAFTEKHEVAVRTLSVGAMAVCLVTLTIAAVVKN